MAPDDSTVLSTVSNAEVDSLHELLEVDVRVADCRHRGGCIPRALEGETSCRVEISVDDASQRMESVWYQKEAIVTYSDRRKSPKHSRGGKCSANNLFDALVPELGNYGVELDLLWTP